MAESQSRAITEAFSSFCYLRVRKQKQNRLRSNFLSPNRFLAHQLKKHFLTTVHLIKFENFCVSLKCWGVLSSHRKPISEKRLSIFGRFSCICQKLWVQWLCVLLHGTVASAGQTSRILLGASRYLHSQGQEDLRIGRIQRRPLSRAPWSQMGDCPSSLQPIYWPLPPLGILASCHLWQQRWNKSCKSKTTIFYIIWTIGFAVTACILCFAI